MEGVGARLGRSSTRYGPTTVFTGPVRKWKKKWIHVSSPNASSSNHQSQTSTATTNGTTNGNNGSHLLLYKWTPITQSQNGNVNGNGNTNNNHVDIKTSLNEDDDDDSTVIEEPPRRKFKYIPVAVLEEQNKEEEEGGEQQVEDEEAKPSETDLDETAADKNRDAFDEKPDINDTPMDEDSQESKDNLVERQDLNESTLDLSLGLKSHDDGDNDSDEAKDGEQLERVNSGT